jgi:hypothetical protein
MKSIKQLSFIGLAIALVLTSCTMEKRVYMSGYHIEWKKSKHNPDRQELASNDNVKQTGQNQTVSVEQSINETNTADNFFAPTNSGFKKLAVQWLNEHLCFVSSAVLADSFVLRNRQLLKPANRVLQ